MINRNGTIAAIKVLNESGIPDLRDFSLDDLVFGRGAVVQYEPIEGAEGRIVFDGEDAIITVNANLENIGKKRFVLAHELAHFEMHKNLLPAFADDDKTLNDWHTKGEHELEANDFAKEILMPENSFKPLCQGKFSMQLIKTLSDTFQTSLTATLLRYKDLGSFPVGVVYIEKGIVRWAQFTNDFKLQFIPNNSKVPVNTVAYDFFYNKIPLSNEPEKVYAIDWFPNDFKLKYNQDWSFNEQCFRIKSDAVLSCLWGQ
ncbi:MAG: ImmA/IrrE family metallo-endopeptidase [Proteobacteria bacterium]|nr:ImmA/IrrE family metallo-endopeptidase [Pseudomonadota bacterium]